MLATRHDRLNALAQLNNASTYLEIGVLHGNTFRGVDIPYKVAVDPHFRFDVDKYTDENTIFHSVTSDEFFAEHAQQHGKFDLIFLDGLHTFEQTFRDFCASLSFAHDKTIWVIDDTLPTGPLSAHPNHTLISAIRVLLRIKDRRWTGDVFKVVFAIRDFFPQFSYATFNRSGQTVVWLEPRQGFAPRWNSLSKIRRLGYRAFLKAKAELRIAPPLEIIGLIKRGLKQD